MKKAPTCKKTIEKIIELKIEAVREKNYELGSVFRELEKMLKKELGIDQKSKKDPNEPNWVYYNAPGWKRIPL